MALNDLRVRRRIERLEAEARLKPRLHSARILWAVLIGYLYPLGMGLLACASLGFVFAIVPWTFSHGDAQLAFFWVVLLVIALGLCAWVVRAFFVDYPEPEGRKILPGEAPQLFQIVEDLRRQLKAPPVSGIYITTQFNAGISYRPHRGLLGRNEVTLSLGFPLLAALNAAQIRAVLAHEFGHYIRHHGRVSSFLRKIRPFSRSKSLLPIMV
jgi:Zn-dependent protease with chaperone function